MSREASHIDMEKLEEKFDRSTISELFSMFLSDTPETLSKLSEAIAEAQFSDVNSLAHYLRSACGTVQARRMESLCQRIERLALHMQAIEDIDSASQELQQLFHETRKEMCSLLKPLA